MKLNKQIRQKTRFLFKNEKQITKNAKIYCYENDIKDLEKCKFTGDDLHVSYKRIEKVSKKLWTSLVKYDDQIKCPLFKWYCFLESGASYEELIFLKENKKLYKIREFFSNCLTKEDLKNELLNDGFLTDAADNIIGDLDFNNWIKIKEFIDRFENVKKYKNMDINYYICRGYSDIKSKEKIYEHANTWAKIGDKIKEDPSRYKKYCDSRLNGLYSQNKISKFEQKIVDKLKDLNYDLTQQFKVNVKQQNKLLKNKSNLICDILLNDSIIIEYYGSYWHNDIVKYKNMEYKNYISEILRLKYINEITKKSIIVLWESDLKDNLELAIQLIEDHIKNNKNFTSSRQIDYELYNTLSVFSLKEAENITL